MDLCYMVICAICAIYGNMAYGNNPFYVNPPCYINNYKLEMVDHIELFGEIYFITHVNKRTISCRKSFYSLQPAGLCY